MQLKRSSAFFLGLILALSAGVVYASFSQSFNFPTAGAGISSNCPTVTTTAMPALGSSGTMTFGCGTNPAFSAIGPVSETPSYTLPASWTLALSLSASCTSPISLVSGTATPLATGAYFYCVNYTNYPSTAPTLTVAWAP